MHVDVRKQDDVVILELVGKLTAGLGDQILRDSLDELLGQGWRKILVNLSEVGFMDSAGVGELVSGLRTAQRLGAQLHLLNTNERVHSTLSIARLLPIFKIHTTEQDALGALARTDGPA
jgi:anti-sigma B factor antagonist